IKKYGLDQTIFIRHGEKILEKYFKFHFQKTLKKEDQEWIIHGMCSMLYHSIKYTCSPFAKTQEPQGMFDEKKIRKYLKRSAMLYYQEISSSHL
ncbi:MAG: hypothetical protein KDD52_10165, partial [Bdellovibrionales bacterium]|nr:hypothetical protein [Bdellovibrionales bacterium]